jgi:serine/threonine protein kinase/tetratricopeptide (TPR) repeat protein
MAEKRGQRVLLANPDARVYPVARPGTLRSPGAFINKSGETLPNPVDDRSQRALGDRWGRVKAVFLAALDLPEADRRTFVLNACAGDVEAAREVASLLDNDRAAGTFCETPAAALLIHETWAGMTAQARLEPGMQLRGYEIIAFIGAGGMGEVYRARDLRLGREVAIKTVPAGSPQGGATTRLIKEARHASSLKHPNICRVHHVGESNGVPFIAMELIDGRTLSDIQRESQLPLDDAVRYAIQVSDALDHAHGRGVVHRDLKSANVIIDGEGRAIVLDFGLAKRLPQSEHASESSSVTQHGPAGTLTHMAPEMLSGGADDMRSDLWSLGVLLYQLVNGHLPFAGRTAFETSAAIMGDSPRPMDRRVPLALRLIIERCLMKKPEERYQRASEVRAALEAVRARHGWRIAGRLLMPGRRRSLQIATAVGLALMAIILASHLRGSDSSAPSFETLAVLPLDNATGNEANDFYAAGMTDALIAELGAVGNMRVISRTSAQRARGSSKTASAIARDLGADAVVEGTLRRSSDRIRLDLRLIGAVGGEVLWSDSFERGARDVLVLQADAVRAVTGTLRSVLRPGARDRLTMVPTINPEVYEAYLKGRYEWNRRTAPSLQKAIEHFTSAVSLDPAYAPAHAALADCYNQLGTVLVGTGSPRDYRPRAEAEAVRALQIDANSSEAHAALGYVRHYQWQWAAAESEFLRAIEVNPSNALARLWYANLLMSRRRFDESLRQAYAARDLDPFSLIVNSNIGWILDYAGRPEEAIEHLTRTVALDPEYPQARWRLGGALASAGRYDEALVQMDKVVRLTNRSPSALSMLANVYARAGRTAEARAVLADILRLAKTQYVPTGPLSHLYASLGDIETALDYMERSYEDGSNAIAYVYAEPWSDEMRANPRFQSLLRRAGHP